MNNTDLIKAFIEGATFATNGNCSLTIKETQNNTVLYSYDEPIVIRDNDGECKWFYFSEYDYSVTTTKHQSLVRGMVNVQRLNDDAIAPDQMVSRELIRYKAGLCLNKVCAVHRDGHKTIETATGMIVAMGEKVRSA